MVIQHLHSSSFNSLDEKFWSQYVPDLRLSNWQTLFGALPSSPCAVHSALVAISFLNSHLGYFLPKAIHKRCSSVSIVQCFTVGNWTSYPTAHRSRSYEWTHLLPMTMNERPTPGWSTGRCYLAHLLRSPCVVFAVIAASLAERPQCIAKEFPGCTAGYSTSLFCKAKYLMTHQMGKMRRLDEWMYLNECICW